MADAVYVVPRRRAHIGEVGGDRVPCHLVVEGPCVVHGQCKKSAETITTYLAENKAFVVYSTSDPTKGKLSHTAYRVVKQTKDFALLEVDLLTGRKNQIVAAIQSVSDVKLLDRSSDLDHNRTVLTLAGTPAGVEEAAFRAIKTAAELIDLNNHTGEHPRIGATDVCPFVPLSEATMEECVAVAKQLGQRVGSELGIPVYLYEAAATRPERTNLENIRKGQYEGLRAEIESNPERVPDFGPAKLGTAGATVIGARNPLIAFNVYLTTSDVDVAKKIAKAIRQSSGGFRYVKGLGMLVEGRAQVSMNLTNFRETPVARVVEMIRREAQRYGVGVHHSELVGLIPQEALTDAAVWYMQLDQFDKSQVLESRLFDATHSAPATNGPSFIEELAAPTPTPGGGSAAAYAGAMGAGLVAMVAGLTIGKKKICRRRSRNASRPSRRRKFAQGINPGCR